MMNQDTFDGYSDGLVNILDLVQEEMILKITKQLSKGKRLTDDDWKVLMLNNYGLLEKSLTRIIEASAKAQGNQVSSIKEKSVKTALTDTDEQLKRLGKAQTAEKFIDQNTMLINTVAQKLSDDIAKANFTMLREAGRDYTKIVTDVLAKKELGAITRQEATKQVVSEWSKKGVPALKDSLGRRWQPDAYVNMVVRTNSLQIAKTTQERRALDYGYDLIITSQHSDQSPEHAPFANKIYSLTGNDPNYPPFSEATSAGFMTRPNCRHYYDFYFRGDKPKTLTKTKKNYELSQEQRKLERRIRELKRQKVALEGLGEDTTLINSKIRTAQGNMRSFINDSGRTRRRDREQI